MSNGRSRHRLLGKRKYTNSRSKTKRKRNTKNTIKKIKTVTSNFLAEEIGRMGKTEFTPDETELILSRIKAGKNKKSKARTKRKRKNKRKTPSKSNKKKKRAKQRRH